MKRAARWFLCLWLGCMGGVLWAQTPMIRLCAEDEDTHPWLLGNGQGANEVMLRLVGQRAGVRFQIDRMPWRRCLVSLKEGQVDGGFKASFNAERAAYLAYPMRGDKVDEERRMLTESYHFYQRRGAGFQWNGTRLNRPPQVVGAQSGFSIVQRLRAMGLTVDDGNRLSEGMLLKLQKGRIDLAALQTLSAEGVLERRPQWLQEVERLEPPIVAQAYFLVFSQPFAQRHAAQVDRIWDAVAAVRESTAYQQALNELLTD